MFRVGVVGAGGVADRIHLPACRSVPEIEIAGLCDLNRAACANLAAKFGIANTFPAAGQMIDAVKPDFVIVGTPPDSHFQICEMALRAGAHVLCEKPFMPTVEAADAIIEIAREKNRLLRVNNQYRFMSFYAETMRRLRAGEFGRLFYIQAWQQMFHPPAKETNWRNQLTQYVLYEFGTHALDLASFFFDALPLTVNAHTPRVRPEFDADVLVQMTLLFPGERLGAFSFNRVTHAPEKYLEMRLDCEEASIRISLGGVARWKIEWVRNVKRPAITFGFVKGGLARAERQGLSRTFSSSSNKEFAAATAEHLKYFLTQMQKPVRSLEGAEHGREILRLVFAGYESARTGETIRFTEPAIMRS